MSNVQWTVVVQVEKSEIEMGQKKKTRVAYHYFLFLLLLRDVCRDCTDKELQQSEEVVMSRVCALIRDNKLMAINLFSIWDFSSLPFRSIPFLQSSRWPFTGLPISLLTCAQTVIDKRNTILTRPGGGDTQFTALHWQYSLTYSLTLLATIRN